jgi:hypothetical protein
MDWVARQSMAARTVRLQPDLLMATQRQATCGGLVHAIDLCGRGRMAEQGIRWRHDFDGAVTDAKTQKRDVLVDFSAAPM